jgi:hypothetical protein
VWSLAISIAKLNQLHCVVIKNNIKHEHVIYTKIGSSGAFVAGPEPFLAPCLTRI